MTDIEIFQLAEKFRNAILKANANGEFFRDNFIELFPRGNCGIVCDLLGRYFLEYANVRSWYTSDETKSECHVWLTFVKAPVQEPLIPESYASESVVGWAMHQKYQNGLPLNRQEEDWKQLGVPLSRATLANWIIYCAENYLRHANSGSSDHAFL